jgi:hypothetical protein
MPFVLNPQWQERLAAPTRTLQIVIVAMAVGCLGFMVIVVFLAKPLAAPPEMPLLSYLALSFVAFAVLVRITLGVVIVGQGCGKIGRGESRSPDEPSRDAAGDDLTAFVQIYQAITIAGAAVFEGVSFFLLIAYMLEGLPIVLAAAMAMIICVLLHFPTRGRMAAWIESKSHLVDQQRQFGR